MPNQGRLRSKTFTFWHNIGLATVASQFSNILAIFETILLEIHLRVRHQFNAQLILMWISIIASWKMIKITHVSYFQLQIDMNWLKSICTANVTGYIRTHAFL